MSSNLIAGPATVPGVLERAALAHPDAPALIEEQGVLTYRELHAAARNAAAALVDLGVSPGDRGPIWPPNGGEWAIASYGVLCAGAAVVPLNPRYTVPEVANIIARAGCALVVAHGSFRGRDLGRGAVEAGASTVVEVGRHGEIATPGGRTTAGGGADEEVDRRMRALTAEHISHVQYTSGTTGRPKGVLLRNGAMVATTRAWVEITDLRSTDRYPVVAPFSHIGGHKTGLLACAVAGAPAAPAGARRAHPQPGDRRARRDVPAGSAGDVPGAAGTCPVGRARRQRFPGLRPGRRDRCRLGSARTDPRSQDGARRAHGHYRVRPDGGERRVRDDARRGRGLRRCGDRRAADSRGGDPDSEAGHRRGPGPVEQPESVGRGGGPDPRQRADGRLSGRSRGDRRSAERGLAAYG